MGLLNLCEVRNLESSAGEKKIKRKKGALAATVGDVHSDGREWCLQGHR